MLGGTLRGEAQHSHTGLFDTGDVFGSLRRDNGNLGQLVLVGVRVGGAVGEDHHAVLSPLLVLEDHDEGTGDDGNAGEGLHNLEGGTEDVARRILSTSHFAIHFLILDKKGSQVQRILHQLHRFVHLHALALTDFAKHLGIELLFRVVLRVDDGGAADVLQSEFGGFAVNHFGVAQKDNLCDFLSDDAVGGLEGSVFLAFSQDDTPVVLAGVFFDLVN